LLATRGWAKAFVKPLIGARTPVTVPQIWLNGNYVGGADDLISQ